MRAPLAAVVLLFAGCVSPLPGADAPAVGDVIDVLPGFEQDHDHLDWALHDHALGLAKVGYHSLVPDTDGADPAARGDWLNSEIVVRGDHAYVAYIGAPWLFAVVDVSDPAAPELVSAFETSKAWGMDIAVSEEGDWVFVALYHESVGATFDPTYLLRDSGSPDGIAGPGVAVIDVRDRADPKLSGFLPIHGLGPHTATYHRYPDGREVIFANKADAPGGNGIVVAEVTETPTGGRTLAPRAFWALGNDLANGNFPHDVDVQEHPVTGKTLLYAAHWDDGLVVLDVSDPSQPTLVSHTPDVGEGEVQIHDVHPYPTLVEGKHYTITTPEIPAGDTSGHLRVWDTTDPAAPVQLGTWVLPGEFVTDSPFLFSTHNFVYLPDGKVALAHGHAGVWVLDWLSDPASPRAVAYLVPSAPGAAVPAWSPVAGAPWVWGTAVGPDGTIWAADVVSGLWGLQRAP